MFIDCIIGLPRVEGKNSMSAVIDQLSNYTYFPVISLEYGETWVTELSCGEMFRVHE
jgi:hypothetical protein